MKIPNYRVDLKSVVQGFLLFVVIFIAILSTTIGLAADFGHPIFCSVLWLISFIICFWVIYDMQEKRTFAGRRAVRVKVAPHLMMILWWSFVAFGIIIVDLILFDEWHLDIGLVAKEPSSSLLHTMRTFPFPFPATLFGAAIFSLFSVSDVFWELSVLSIVERDQKVESSVSF